MRIAIIGGADYVETAFEDFLYALHAKYPDAVIVTGTAAGKNEYREVPGQTKKELVRQIPSAERMAESLMTGLGHEVIIPDMTTPTARWFAGTKMSQTDLQLGWILSGQWELYRDERGKTQHRFITPRADVIVTVGNEASSRAAYAHDHWKKMDAWREPENRRPYHNVAAPPVKKQKPKPRRATKKKELLAA